MNKNTVTIPDPADPKRTISVQQIGRVVNLKTDPLAREKLRADLQAYTRAKKSADKS